MDTSEHSNTDKNIVIIMIMIKKKLIKKYIKSTSKSENTNNHTKKKGHGSDGDDDNDHDDDPYVAIHETPAASRCWRVSPCLRLFVYTYGGGYGTYVSSCQTGRRTHWHADTIEVDRICYSLQHACIHMGEQAMSGHYRAMLWDRDCCCFLISDDGRSVDVLSPPDADKLLSTSCYLLFYPREECLTR